MQHNNKLVFKILDNDGAHYLRAVLLHEEAWQLKLSEKEKAEEKNNIRIAGFLDGAIVATTMLTRDDDKFFLQRVVVAKDFQNKGIGSQLLKFCEEFVQENEARVIYAHAREGFGRSAVNFYVKNEYFCGDEEFLEDGAPHKIVWKIFA